MIYRMLPALVFCCIVNLWSQTLLEPEYSSIYNFVERMEDKGVIHSNDLIKPFTLREINAKLVKIKRGKNNLNTKELRELYFYYSWYKPYNLDSSVNARQSMLFKGSDYGRRFYWYQDDQTFFSIDPIYGMEVGTIANKFYYHRWNGVKCDGILGDHLEFYLSFRDNREQGDKINRKHYFSPDSKGIVDSLDTIGKNFIEYSEVNAGIVYSFSRGKIALVKDFVSWGYGLNGNLVMGTKAPSFPYIRLDYKITPNINLNYMHMWLKSDVMNVNSSYNTGLIGRNRIQYYPKYLASHSLQIALTRAINLNIGESIVYSDRIKVPYLIPVMFFRLADHYLSDRINDAGDNAQIFMNICARNMIPNTKIYFTIFIDELSLTTLFDRKERKNQSGISLGVEKRDVGIASFDIGLSYTRINPFVYMHYIPTIDYRSSGANLGHWIGTNADQVYGYIQYKFIQRLNIKAFFEYIRKGSAGTYDQQYRLPQPDFLFGTKHYFSNFGLKLSYQFIHNLYFQFAYQNMDRILLQSHVEIYEKNVSHLAFRLNYGF